MSVRFCELDRSRPYTRAPCLVVAARRAHLSASGRFPPISFWTVAMLTSVRPLCQMRLASAPRVRARWRSSVRSFWLTSRSCCSGRWYAATMDTALELPASAVQRGRSRPKLASMRSIFDDATDSVRSRRVLSAPRGAFRACCRGEVPLMAASTSVAISTSTVGWTSAMYGEGTP